MQAHQGECRIGDVLSLNILEGRAIEGDTVRLIVRAPAKILIIEELVAPP